MAYSQSLKERYDAGAGYIHEVYSFDGASVTTSGAQTPDTTDAAGIGVIKIIESVTPMPGASGCFSTLASTRASHTLTFTSSDTGWYVLRGKRA